MCLGKLFEDVHSCMGDGQERDGGEGLRRRNRDR